VRGFRRPYGKVESRNRFLNSPVAATLPDPVLNPTRPGPAQRGFNLWIQRLKLGIDVVFFIELGMILLVLPWTSVWTQNSLLTGFPTLQTIADHGFLRGSVSGLGLINIWIGIYDAVQYKEHK
jgi:hypothetical protein